MSFPETAAPYTPSAVHNSTDTYGGGGGGGGKGGSGSGGGQSDWSVIDTYQCVGALEVVSRAHESVGAYNAQTAYEYGMLCCAVSFLVLSCLVLYCIVLYCIVFCSISIMICYTISYCLIE